MSATFESAACFEDACTHMIVQIKKAFVAGWIHMKDGTHLTLTRKRNAKKARPIGIGATTGAFAEILADASCGSQALNSEMSGKRQCRDTVIELKRKVIDAKCLGHK